MRLDNLPFSGHQEGLFDRLVDMGNFRGAPSYLRDGESVLEVRPINRLCGRPSEVLNSQPPFPYGGH